MTTYLRCKNNGNNISGVKDANLLLRKKNLFTKKAKACASFLQKRPRSHAILFSRRFQLDTPVATSSSRSTPSFVAPRPFSFVSRARKSITRRRLEYGVRKLAAGRTSVNEKWFDKMVQSRGSASLRGVSQRVWLSGRL